MISCNGHMNIRVEIFQLIERSLGSRNFSNVFRSAVEISPDIMS